MQTTAPQSSRALPVALCVAALALTSLSCKGGKTGELVRPTEFTAGDAMGEAKCVEVPSRGTPLIVDWASHERGDLEEIMNGSVAVVRYDCEGLRLLPDCTIEGSYGFVASSQKEDVIQLEGNDEIMVNLPANGVAIAAGLDRDSTLDLGLIMVGKRRAAVQANFASSISATAAPSPKSTWRRAPWRPANSPSRSAQLCRASANIRAAAASSPVADAGPSAISAAMAGKQVFMAAPFAFPRGGFAFVQ